MLYLFPETWNCCDREAQPLDETTRKIIRRNSAALTSSLDSNRRLFDKLYGESCLSASQIEIIEEQKCKTQKIEKLLDILLRKSLAAFDAFLSCLEEAQQARVRSLLDGTAGN
jgi:Caspase recruitment domain